MSNNNQMLVTFCEIYPRNHFLCEKVQCKPWMLLVLREEDVAAEGIVLVCPPEAVHCVGRETLLRRAVHIAGGRGGDHEVGGIDWTKLYLSTPANSE